MLLSDLHEKASRKGTYAAVRFSDDTLAYLEQLQHKLKVPNPHPKTKFHTTLLYSRKHLPNYEGAGKLNPSPLSDTNAKLEIWPSHKEGLFVLVLQYKCDWLEDRHSFLMDEHKAEYDFPEYIPHITLSYDIGDWKPDSFKIELSQPLELVQEYHEDLDLD